MSVKIRIDTYDGRGNPVYGRVGLAIADYGDDHRDGGWGLVPEIFNEIIQVGDFTFRYGGRQSSLLPDGNKHWYVIPADPSLPGWVLIKLKYHIS